jgi:hypothetical protein
MKTQDLSVHSAIWYLIVLAMIIAGLFVVSRPAAQQSSTPRVGIEVLSFDMWCLEMQFYPAARCDSRRNDDVKDYETYRSSVEKFTDQRAARDKRDLELKNRLNRAPGDVKN